MTITLADVLTPLSSEQYKESMYNVLAAVGTNTTTWKPGAVVRTLIAALAIFFAALHSLIAKVARGGFLETAFGSWLTLCARYVFGVEREVATFAAGEVTLTNTGGGVYELEVGDLIVSNPDTGKTYRNTSAFTLAALGTVTVPIAAIEAGAASTAVPGAITVLETTLDGVTCTNAAALVGLDEEGDSVLKARCSAKLGALSPNGPWDAYAYVAKNATRSDGTRIGVTRVRVFPDGYGNVYVVAATATGAVSGTEDDPTTDLGAVASAIQRLSTPLCITAIVGSAGSASIALTYGVWMYNTSGRSNAEVEAAISTALATHLSTQPIGGNVIGAAAGKVFLSDLIGVIKAVFPGEIFRVVITVPAADPELAPEAVPTLGTVTANIIQVNPPVGH